MVGCAVIACIMFAILYDAICRSKLVRRFKNKTRSTEIVEIKRRQLSEVKCAAPVVTM